MSAGVGYRTFLVHDDDGVREIHLRGRYRWALEQMLARGEKGVTPIEQPAPRWSHYIHELRHVYALNIETITEKHAGPFPGSHARYVLRDRVAAFPDSTAREAA